MMFNAALVITLANIATVFSASVPPPPGAECGDLGVTIDDGTLPPDINATDVRTCTNHPLSNQTALEHSLDKRNCVWNKKSGCDKGYCWKKCGNEGQWCWTARVKGFGDWYTCGSDRDCNEKMDCGNASGGCDSCGCSC